MTTEDKPITWIKGKVAIHHVNYKPKELKPAWNVALYHMLHKDFLCFTKDHDREEAINKFTKRFGYKPEIIVEDNMMLWVGPTQKENINDKNS